MANPNWTKGVSGNPNGRPPKEQSLTEILRNKVDPEEVADKLIQMAIENEDMAALKYIYDRVDGRPKESVDMNHSGGIDIDYEFRIVDIADTKED